MTVRDRQLEERARVTDALRAFDEGAQLLEQAYRELWTARETERGASDLDAAERIRDLCHEVKNPLGGVRGLAALLERELGTLSGAERAHRLLSRMIEGLDACDEVLSASAAEDEATADAGRVAEEVCGLALAERRAAGDDVRFRVDVPEGLEVPLPTVAFREVLGNLVRNAAEACGARGEVRVRVTSDLDHFAVIVADDGPGLPPVTDGELFRRGWSTKGTGRGRGLAVTADLVERAGGTLHLARLARGTHARVRIPRS